MPASSERLVQPVDLARALLDLRLAIAREVAQLADRLGRHEVGLQQPRLGELAQPRRVGDVGLAARDLLDVPGVDQHALELVLQDRPRRLPIDAGGLHHHLRARRGRPASRAAPAARGPWSGTPRRAARAGRARPGTRTHAVTCALWTSSAAGRSTIVSILASFRVDRPPTAAQGPQRTNESDSRARSTLRSSGETPHAKLKTGSQAPRQRDRRHGRRPNHPPLFKTPEGARQPLRELARPVVLRGWIDVPTDACRARIDEDDRMSSGEAR